MRNRTTSSNTPPGQRQLRVGERIRHLLAEILREGAFRDPELQEASLITITAVEIGPDLKHATAYVMPLGGKNAEAIIAALNRAAGYFRGEMGRGLDMRYTPKVSFRFDQSFDKAAHIESLLQKVRVEKMED